MNEMNEVKQILKSELSISDKIDEVMKIGRGVFDRTNELKSKKDAVLDNYILGKIDVNEWLSSSQKLREEISSLEKEQKKIANVLKKLLNQYCCYKRER